MSDLVKRLRDKYCCDNGCNCDEAADRIEQLERELAESRKNEIAFFEANEGLGESCRAAHAELAAEKALADGLFDVVAVASLSGELWMKAERAMCAYRKARGM